MKERMLRFDITAVVLVACLFNFGDAVITGWTDPSTISGPSGTLDGISIAEDLALGETVATFAATAGSSVSEYALLTTGTPFSVNTSTGLLKLSAVLDYENITSYIIEVKLLDISGVPSRALETGGAVGTATVEITVTDSNEATPTFDETHYTVCVTDGFTAETVTTFSATDADTSDTIIYSINSGNQDGDFIIPTGTAKLEVASGKTLDKDTIDSYTLVIYAKDTVGTVRTGSATYTVNVKSSCSPEGRSGAAALTMTFITLFLALISTLTNYQKLY